MNTAHDVVFGWLKDTFQAVMYDNIYDDVVTVSDDEHNSLVSFLDGFIIVNSTRFYYNSPTFFEDVYNEIKKRGVGVKIYYDP